MLVASIGNTGELITGIGTLLLALTAAASAVVALRNYGNEAAEWTQSREREAREAEERSSRWLTALQERFCRDSRFQSVRRQFYIGNGSPMATAFAQKLSIERKEVPAGTALTEAEAQLIAELDSYLDYFGLIWHLVEDEQLDANEAYRLFAWYLTTGLEGITVIFDEVTAKSTEFQDMKLLYDRFREMDAVPGPVVKEAGRVSPPAQPSRRRDAPQANPDRLAPPDEPARSPPVEMSYRLADAVAHAEFRARTNYSGIGVSVTLASLVGDERAWSCVISDGHNWHYIRLIGDGVGRRPHLSPLDVEEGISRFAEGLPEAGRLRHLLNANPLRISRSGIVRD